MLKCFLKALNWTLVPFFQIDFSYLTLSAFLQTFYHGKSQDQYFDICIQNVLLLDHEDNAEYRMINE